MTEKAKRRRYAVEYKARILGEPDGWTKPGDLGALLRREGLYVSHLASLRAQAARGELAALEPKKRVSGVCKTDPLATLKLTPFLEAGRTENVDGNIGEGGTSGVGGCDDRGGGGPADPVAA